MTQIEKAKIEIMRKQGLSAGKIAGQLGLSVNTVKAHLRRHVAKHKKVSEAAHPGLCKQCEKPMEHLPSGRQKLFCSDICRMAWWNSHRDFVNRRGMITATCPSCGRQFGSYEKERRKYCSHGCYIKARFGGKSSHDARTI